MSFNGGWSWPQSSKALPIYYYQARFNPLVEVDNSAYFFVGQVDFGIEKNFSNTLVIQWGGEIEATGGMEIQGEIPKTHERVKTKQFYRYCVKHQHLAAKAKLLANKHYFIMPWVSFALGVGLNTAYQYENIAEQPEPLFRHFDAGSTTHLTYTLGVGVQRAMTEHYQMGLGYEFANWGNSRLGPNTNQNLYYGPELSPIYTNSLLLNITYRS